MSRKPQGQKIVNWKITINNPTDEDEKQFDNSEKFKYAVFGREVGENGTPHLQGMVSLKVANRLTWVSKLFPRANILPANDAGYADYCKKDGDFFEFGIRPLTGGQKTKKNWELAKQLAIAGKLEEIEGSIYLPYYNQLKHISADHRPSMPSLDTLANEWHYGPTGTGKSRTVREKWPLAFIKDTTEWWNGYADQDVVIIEDLDKYHVKLGYYLKIWSDHYPFPGNIKGSGQRMIRPGKIIITSNYHPRQIWEDDQTTEPIMRRFEIIEYPERPIRPFLRHDNEHLPATFLS